MFKTRRARLERFFKEHAVDAILFSNLLNIRYLTGFTGSDGVLIATPEEVCLFCDSRYTTQARQETVDTGVVQFSDRKNSVSQYIQDKHYSRVAFEAAHTTVTVYNELSSSLEGCELVQIGIELDQIRHVKDADEIEQLGVVAGLASEALKSVMGLIRAGVSEKQIAAELEMEMIRRGADGRAFDFIVASGERGAMPHGRASQKLIADNELVTIDFGAVLNGFYSDETVTLAVGKPVAELLKIHAVVKEAHDMAIAAVRPGLVCSELDGIARDYINSCGYGEYFGHGLGHGVGLEIHERPVISPRSSLALESGMVFTIEPGIYVPGLGGVRIEDTVVVTENSCRVLTGVPKELVLL